MNTQRLAIALSAINLAILTLTFSQNRPAVAQAPATPEQGIVSVLRGRALEIVDDQGRVRASIEVHGPTTVDGRLYPETVLLRLRDPKHGPIVKIEASSEGAGLGLSDDSEKGGVRLMAKNRTGTFVEVTNKDGKKRFVRP